MSAPSTPSLSRPRSPGDTPTSRPPSFEERRQSTELYSLDVFSFLLTNSLVLGSLVNEGNFLQMQERLAEAAEAVPWRPFGLKWEIGKHEAYTDIWDSYTQIASQATEAESRQFELVTVHAIAPANPEPVHLEPAPESTPTSTSGQSARSHSVWSGIIAIPEGGVDFYHHTPTESGHCGWIPHGVGGKRTALGALLGFFKCVRSHRAQQEHVDTITLYGAAQDGADYVLLKLTPDGAFYQCTIRLGVRGNDSV